MPSTGSGNMFPRPLMDASLNFSFSGLKTAVSREWKKYANSTQPNNPELVTAFSYEIQEAITDVLVKKTLRAAEIHSVKSVLISGGVAANKRLREKFQEKCSAAHLSFFSPEIHLCTDNAAMIAACAFYQNATITWKEIKAQPNLSVEV